MAAATSRLGALGDSAAVIRAVGNFPTDDALIKLLYLGCREMRWAAPLEAGGVSDGLCERSVLPKGP